MTATCKKEVVRIPRGPKEPCGRPVVEDGLCALHLGVRARRRAKLAAMDWAVDAMGYAPGDPEYEPPLVGVADCAAELAKWQRWFDEAILRAYKQGESLRSIAAAAGMSHEQVRRIVSR